jgi:hypothetical protein
VIERTGVVALTAREQPHLQPARGAHPDVAARGLPTDLLQTEGIPVPAHAGVEVGDLQHGAPDIPAPTTQRPPAFLGMK